MRRDDRLVLSRSGDVLTVNGEAFDFSGVPEGSTLPLDAVASDWLAAGVERIGGALHITLILPHGASAPQETVPAPGIDPPDGPIHLPPQDAEEDAVNAEG